MVINHAQIERNQRQSRGEDRGMENAGKKDFFLTWTVLQDAENTIGNRTFLFPAFKNP